MCREFQCFIVIFMLFFSMHLYADEAGAKAKSKDYQAVYDACVQRAGSIDNEVVAGCSERVSTQENVEMNALYLKMHGRLMGKAPADAARLEKAQKDWLSFRDVHCDLAGKYIGDPQYSYCPMKMNMERVKELRELVGE